MIGDDATQCIGDCGIPTSAIWYPYVCFCFQHIAWLLQAKVEEPRAADTEGPAMKPKDATRVVGSRATKMAVICVTNGLLCFFCEWISPLTMVDPFAILQILPSHVKNICLSAFQRLNKCFRLIISSNTWNGSGCDRTKWRNPKLKLRRRSQRPVLDGLSHPIVWR